MTTPESIALMPDGACEWASGSQVCIGTMAVFTPKPIRNRAPAASNCGVGPLMAARASAMFTVPVSANTSAMPRSTSIEPAVDCTRYFTPASSAFFCSL